MLPVVHIDVTKSRLNECVGPETPDQSDLKTDVTAYSQEIFTPVENRFNATTAKIPPGLSEPFLFSLFTFLFLNDVRAHCYCVSLQRTQIHMPRHASSAR